MFIYFPKVRTELIAFVITVERSAKPDAVVLNKQEAQELLLTQHSRYMTVAGLRYPYFDEVSSLDWVVAMVASKKLSKLIKGLSAYFKL